MFHNKNKNLIFECNCIQINGRCNVDTCADCSRCSEFDDQIKFKNGVFPNEIVNHMNNERVGLHFASIVFNAKNNKYFIDWKSEAESDIGDIIRYFIRLGQMSARATPFDLDAEQIFIGGSTIITSYKDSNTYNPELICFLDDIATKVINKPNNKPVFPSIHYNQMPEEKQLYYDHSIDYIENTIQTNSDQLTITLLDKESSDNDTNQSEDSLLDLEQVNINLSQLALDNIARYERYTDNHQQITKQAIENINKHKNFQKMLITEQQPSSRTSNKENKPINKNLCKLGCGQIYTRGHSCPKRRN